MRKVVPFIAAIVLSANAYAAELHGAKLPDTITREAKALQLNGIGVRTKTILGIKVYVAGLYLETRSTDPERIIQSDAVRELRIQMTHNAPRDRLVAELREGIERNAKDLPLLEARLERFLDAIPKLNEGQGLSITYVPGKGTSLVATGGSAVILPGKDFAAAVFGAWLGKHPLDEDLKEQLLGPV